MKRFIVCVMTLSFLFVMGGGTAMSSEYIVNGNFETGDFTGWNVDFLNIGEDTWVINDGDVEIPIPDSLDTFYASEPINGFYDAISDYTAYGLYVGPISLLTQNVTLPTNISSATLSWKDRIYSFADFDPEFGQFFAVGIEDDSGDLTILFFTSEDDLEEQPGPNLRSITEFEVDGTNLSLTDLLQSLEGQEVTITFAVIAEQGPLFVTVDDISLDIVTVLPVEIDIKPGSDPNCFNINGNGVIPVAILGSADLDVSEIDVTTLSFAGLEVRVRGNKGPLCSIEDSNEDTFPDLVCHFEDEAENWTAGTDPDADITGALLDGTLISGTDEICIVP